MKPLQPDPRNNPLNLILRLFKVQTQPLEDHGLCKTDGAVMAVAYAGNFMAKMKDELGYGDFPLSFDVLH